MLYNEQRVVLKFENDADGTEKAFVDLNRAYGHPCGATSPLQAHDFKTTELALAYAAHFTTYPLKIRQEAIILNINVIWMD